MARIKGPTHHDLLGQRFGRLTVIAESDERTSWGSMKWVCKCDCGTIKTIDAQALKKGYTTSCGCYHKEELTKRATKHGHSRVRRVSPTYHSWAQMFTRCYNKNDPAYKYYGARGIKVCDSWHKFENFLKDMGERPEGKSIDRIDFNGDYEPGNCRWITQKEQTNNTRRNVFFVLDGKKLTVSQLAEIAGLNYNTLYDRLMKSKWPLEKAMSTKPLSIKECSMYGVQALAEKRGKIITDNGEMTPAELVKKMTKKNKNYTI